MLRTRGILKGILHAVGGTTVRLSEANWPGNFDRRGCCKVPSKHADKRKEGKEKDPSTEA